MALTPAMAQKAGHKLSHVDSLNYYYTQAVINSAYTDSAKISHHLIAITDSNHSIITKNINGEKYILTVTWKGWLPNDTISTHPYTIPGDFWITIAPELKNKVRHIDSNHVYTRLQQMLGVPPYSTYTYFWEMWVRTQDIFRPCPDPEITDNSCGLAFPINTDSLHIKWINAQRLSRFFVSDTSQRYPWTDLGYTYDWDPQNPSHMGCSEFVIRPGANVYIKHIYSTNGYIYGK